MITHYRKPGNLSIVSDHAGRRIAWVVTVMLAINLMLPISQYIYASETGQAFWRMFRGDFGPTEWFSSVQLVIIALVAYGNYRLGQLESTFQQSMSRSSYRIWGMIACGFLLFAIDERFGIHNMLRDEVFRPAGLFTEVAWLRSGDVGLHLFYLAGLAVTPFLMPELRRQPWSVVFYIAAMALTLPVITVDSLKKSATADWPNSNFWNYPFEEIGEIWAQFLFLVAFLLVSSVRFNQMNTWRMESRKH